MFKQSHRSRVNSVKRKTLEKSILQDMNFLSLKEFYNSIPDYSDINHLPEKEFYREINQLKKKQQLLTEQKAKSQKTKIKKPVDNSNSRSSHHFDSFSIGNNAYETKRNITEHISFADDGNSISSWQLEYGSITCRKRDNQSRLSSSHSRPQTSRAESRGCKNHSRISDVQDDYNLLNSLRNCRSKSISPTRSQMGEFNYLKNKSDESKFYSDITQDKIKSTEHIMKRDPIKEIPITSRIPLLKQVQADQEHKSRLARLDSAIKLQSQMKPFHFNESRSSSRKCLSRSFSTPQLKNNSDESDCDDGREVNTGMCFKAKPFPKNLFCNYFHYKMWEDNYFRALNNKLRAEELLKQSKLPPSMAKRENEKKKTDNLNVLDIERVLAANNDEGKHSVEFSPLVVRKKKHRKKLKKSKSAIASSRSQFAKSFIFESKRDKDRGSIKSDGATTSTSTSKHRESPSDANISPIYPVNRPNLAATLRYEWSREKLKRFKDAKEMMMRDKFRKPSWGVKNTHAFHQMTLETSNDDEIAIRLATRKAEQKLRQEEHELNMELMKQRVKTAPLLLEGPTHLAPRLGHIYHHCDVANDKKKIDNLIQQNNLLKPPPSSQHHHHLTKNNRPESTISTDSKRTDSTYTFTDK